ncbi:putative transporter YfdV [Marinomonas aquimarina]|uniref:Putative transporter YfdV n=1 Tax=Marinomonas aquimarina TaxID=295068 RepID=A0A1A8TGE9_9GAMM|nr:AEC family transporter [Marinomonas aquimarina]SBS32225.1 putative transporter YfdV [Marinomonas aquimarina]
MFEMLFTTAPIFILMALGYSAVRTRLVSDESIAGMAKIVLYFTLPALIFSTLAKMDSAEVFVPEYLLAFSLASLLSLAIGILFTVWALKKDTLQASLKGAGMACSNSGFFGFPVMLLVFDDPPTAAFAMTLMGENAIILPTVFALLSYFSSKDQGLSLAQTLLDTSKRLAKNPLVLAVICGMFFSQFHLTLPDVADRVLLMLSGASATLALMVLGGSLVGTSMKGNVADISAITFGKLIIHPACMALFMWLIPGIDQHLKVGAVVLASVPMMSIYPIIGSQYGYRSFCASALLVTTIACFLTLPVLLTFIGQL